VSLVNLTMALGIAVEFCAHPVHAFMEASGDRPARAAAALRSAGASVLCGIALTKLIGAPRTGRSPALTIYHADTVLVAWLMQRKSVQSAELSMQTGLSSLISLHTAH